MSSTPLISNTAGGGTNAKAPRQNDLEKKGCLEATVLSAYDLPYADRPTAVVLQACGTTVQSGPPSARHKDRNSFRFASAAQGSPKATGAATASSSPSAADTDVVKLVAPLRQLYQSDLIVRVIYANNPKQHLETTYSLRQLRVAETKWLILNLAPSTGTVSTALSTSSTSSSKTTNTTSGGDAASLPDDMDMAPPPTLRIKLKLTGPYRAEFSAAVGLAQAWFGLVDGVEQKASSVVSKAPTIPHKEWLLVPIVPVIALVVVASPVVAGITMVGLPFFLPVILVAIVALVGALTACGVVYASTQQGRAQVAGTVAPMLEHLVGSRAGQTLLYDTGPRPTPVSVCRQVVPSGMWSRLVLSLLVDLIGSSSYLLPLVGEGLDLAWAPVQTTILMSMYDSTSPNLKYVSFVEEILPFTDVVPSATIGWATQFIPVMLHQQSKDNPEMANVVKSLVARTSSGTSTTQS